MPKVEDSPLCCERGCVGTSLVLRLFLLLVGVVGVVVHLQRKNIHKHRRHGNDAAVSKDGKAVTIPLIDIADGAIDAIDSISMLLTNGPALWPIVNQIVEALQVYKQSLRKDTPDPPVIAQVLAALEISVTENKVLRDFAAQSKDFVTAAIYTERTRLLEPGTCFRSG